MPDHTATASPSQAPVTVRPVETKQDKTDFIRLWRTVYAGAPEYIPPLEFEIGERLDASKNPVLKDNDHQLWLATRGDEVVGRISAIVNRTHLAKYDDATGHFGFIEGVDDENVFSALYNAAEDWLRARGMKRIAGPYSFSVNEECGMLIDGFETAPFVLMPHGRPWFQKHTEALGYAKASDRFALIYANEKQFIPEKRQRFVEKALSSDRVSIRNIDMKNFAADIKTIVNIYNDAWSENWGSVPLSDAQAEHMASELRLIIDQKNVVMCYYDGEPAAFGIVLPNINEAIADFEGKLFPFNWARLVWKLKVRGVRSSRMPLMGVVKRLQRKPVGTAFAYKIIDMVNSHNIETGIRQSELSWILETNPSMLNMLTDMGGKIYKTYRIYEKEL